MFFLVQYLGRDKMISLLRDSWVKWQTSPGRVRKLSGLVQFYFYFSGCDASSLCCFCGANQSVSITHNKHRCHFSFSRWFTTIRNGGTIKQRFRKKIKDVTTGRFYRMKKKHTQRLLTFLYETSSLKRL